MNFLAMHMANELLSLPAAGAAILFAAAAVGVSAWRVGRKMELSRLPLMGVLGAFVFAAQMINFTLPGMPGTSGHLGGGVLLAVVLGPAAGIVTITGVLIVQCLLFQDGGLLALGCNIINMGVVPCLLGWGAYKLLLGRQAGVPAWRQFLSAWAACIVGVAGGAALVPVESGLSGVLKIPVGDFLVVMICVHLLIGFIEGAITFAVIAYLRSVRPAALGLAAPDQSAGVGTKAVVLSIVLTSLLIAGVGSWFASTHPDGLEWSYLDHKYGPTKQNVQNNSATIAAADDFQNRWSLMPDYTKRQSPLGQPTAADKNAGRPAATGQAEEKPAERAAAWPDVSGWKSLAGLTGTVATLVIVYLVSLALRRRQNAAGKPTV